MTFFSALLVFTAMIHAASPTYDNIALGRPTMESSQFFPGTTYTSSNAVDGNLSPYFDSDSCTHTNGGLTPWWSVDLGARRFVATVVITQRGDGCCIARHRSMRIGTTDVAPNITSPNVNNIVVCAGQDEPIPDPFTQPYHCGAEGRYLVVLLDGWFTLTLCEVQVFEGRSRIRMVKVPGTRMTGRDFLSVEVDSEIVCMRACKDEPRCSSVNIRGIGSGFTCEMNEAMDTEIDSVPVTADPEWSLYKISY